MSDAPADPAIIPEIPEPPPDTTVREPIWAKPAISIFALGIFMGAFAIAAYAQDKTSVAMMIGASIGMASQVVNYYLGSSSGSADKSNVISAAAIAKPKP